MTTMTIVEELYRANLRAGINRDDALAEAQIHARYLASSAPPPAAPPAPVLVPAERAWAAQLDADERRAAIWWQRTRDPMRIAAAQAEELRLRTAIDALDTQLRPLQQQRAALVAALDQLLFHG